MSGLLQLLNLGASAFQAQNAGIAVAGRNIANVNTEGYSREDINLSSQLGPPMIGGVIANDPTRAQSSILSGRERDAAGSSGMASSQASALSSLQDNLTGLGANVAQAVGDFFAAANRLSVASASASLRQALVDKAQALAQTLQASAHAVAQAQSDANQRIVDLGTKATQLAQQVAAANKTLKTNNDPVIADQRDQAAKQLAQIVGGQARVDSDGMMRVTVGSGAVLVDGTKAMSVQTSSNPTNPTQMSVNIVDGSSKIDVTKDLDGGQIAGEIAFRDGAAQTAANDLDNLANDIATKVNAVHSANAGLDGVTGRNLFTPPAGVSGAAANFAVDPTVAGDPSKLATAAPGEGTSGTGGIMALVALGDSSNVAGGGARSFIDEGVRMLSAVGSAASAANTSQTAESAKVSSLASVRDSLSGVSQQDELAKLASFQHAAEAATQFVSTVNNLLDNMIQNL